MPIVIIRIIAIVCSALENHNPFFTPMLTGIDFKLFFSSNSLS